MQSEKNQAHDQENALMEGMKELHTKVADLSGANSSKFLLLASMQIIAGNAAPILFICMAACTYH